MDAVTIESLYENESYNNYLVSLAGKNLLPFDDYRQEVFLYLAEHGGDVSKVAGKIAKRMQRHEMKRKAYSFDDNRDSIDSNFEAVLWEERHVLQEV